MHLSAVQPQALATIVAPDGSIPSREGGVWRLPSSRWHVAGPTRVLSGIKDYLGGGCQLIGNIAVLDFRESVGRFEIPYLGPAEVSSGKLGSAAFDAMLQDLSRVALGLPFRASAGGALPFARSKSARKRVLYHAFVYLRHLMSDAAPPEDQLAPALESVLREPHRRLVPVTRRVPLGACRSLAPSALVSMVTRRLHPAPRDAPGGHLPLARALEWHLPEEVDESRHVVSLDTPENRLVKAFLDQAIHVVTAVDQVVAESSCPAAFGVRVRNDCARLSAAFRRWRRHGTWASVGTMTQVPTGSTTLQRRRGYRQIFRAFTQLGLASHIPLSERDAVALLEIRDIAALYELWCYFSVVDALSEHLGPAKRAQAMRLDWKGTQVPWGYKVEWAGDLSVYHNLRFSHGATPPFSSSSLPLRPDIVVKRGRGAGAELHVLDAKYKVRDLAALDEEDDAPPSGTYAREDIAKMHTYRDALPNVRSAWILYPGAEVLFFGAQGRVTDAGELTGGVEGVGAVPALPGVAGGLEQILSTMTNVHGRMAG